MEGMNESYSHSSFFLATAPAEQRLSNFSHPKIRVPIKCETKRNEINESETKQNQRNETKSTKW